MALTVKIPMADVAMPEADTLSHTFRAHGGKNIAIGEQMVFPFSPAGENYFTAEAYALCEAMSWVCDGGEFYTVVPDSKLTEDVPEGFPDRLIPSDIEGEDSTVREWGEYARSTWGLGDGTALLLCLCFVPGATTAANGLSNVERLLWTAEFGSLIVKADGNALKPAVIEPVI